MGWYSLDAFEVGLPVALDVAVFQPVGKVAGVIAGEGLDEAVVGGLVFRGAVVEVGEDLSANADIDAGFQEVGYGVVEVAQMPRVDLHQSNIDGFALFDEVAGDLSGGFGGGGFELSFGAVDVQGIGIVAVFAERLGFDLDDLENGFGVDLWRTQEREGEDGIG